MMESRVSNSQQTHRKNYVTVNSIHHRHKVKEIENSFIKRE